MMKVKEAVWQVHRLHDAPVMVSSPLEAIENGLFLAVEAS
jgi:hypothetical protein